MLRTSTLEINYLLLNFSIRDIGSIKAFLNFIDVISIKVQNSMLDLKVFCSKAYRNLNFMMNKYINSEKIIIMLAMILTLSFIIRLNSISHIQRAKV